MDRKEVLVRIAQSLISTNEFSSSGQNIDALVKTAAEIADKIETNHIDYVNSIVTEDDEELIEQMMQNQTQQQSVQSSINEIGPIVPNQRPKRNFNQFIDED